MEFSIVAAKNADALWLLYSLMVAGLGLFVQECMEPGMILRRYYLFLTYVWIRNRRRKHRWKRWWLKPAGMCVYCNTTWIAIAYYLIRYGLNVELLLFVGLVFVWLKALKKFLAI